LCKAWDAKDTSHFGAPRFKTRGKAELRWLPGGERCELRLAGSAGLEQDSAGAIDAAGGQGGLSGLLQRAAVLEARPALAIGGARIALPVFGARGDEATRNFFVAEAAVQDGLVHVVREAAGPHDAGVDLWLDPRRHHLPARLRARAVDERRPGFELMLGAAGGRRPCRPLA
jgi:hypothetical protein